VNDPVAVDDGKYTFFMGVDGLLDCFRHGEPWPAFRETGGHLAKSTLALYHELLLFRETKDRQSSYRAWSEAFAIFAKYSEEVPGTRGGNRDDVSAEHDEVYAGPSPEVVTKSDSARLEELGWLPCGEHDCWKRFS
jgi:hypothetical protein